MKNYLKPYTRHSVVWGQCAFLAWWTTPWGTFCSLPLGSTNCLQQKMQIKMTKAIKFNPFSIKKKQEIWKNSIYKAEKSKWKSRSFCGFFMWKMYCIMAREGRARLPTVAAERQEQQMRRVSEWGVGSERLRVLTLPRLRGEYILILIR